VLYICNALIMWCTFYAIYTVYMHDIRVIYICKICSADLCNGTVRNGFFKTQKMFNCFSGQNIGQNM
jgi:hypothetical protein